MRPPLTIRSFRSLALALIAGTTFIQSTFADDWGQWLGPRRDDVWREKGIIEKFPESGPKFLWRQAIGAGFASPSIANGRVFVADRLTPKDGVKPSNPFATDRIPGIERVLCLSEDNGKILWKHEYDSPYTVSYAAGPRAMPQVDGDRVYTLGTMGDLNCFDVATGKVIWSCDFKSAYNLKVPLWGCSASPLIDGDKLICLGGGPDGLVVAFDKMTGKERWRAISARELGYCPPVIYTINGKRQLIIWHPAAVTGLDPENGAELWTSPWTIRSELSVAIPRQVGNDLFFTAFYNGSQLLRFTPDAKEPTVVWRTQKVSERDTTHLNSILSTPFVEGGYVYGSCSYGQFRCLKVETGERIWESFTPTGGKEARWASTFVTKNGDRFFLFNEKGDLLIAKLSPKGYEEISRAHILDPLNPDPGRLALWSHPSFANRHLYARNDKEIVCVDLAAGSNR